MKVFRITRHNGNSHGAAKGAEMNQEQLEQLAVFAGAKPWSSPQHIGPSDQEGWFFPQLKKKGAPWPIISRKDWQPHLRPEQADLILRALAKRYYLKMDIRLGGHVFLYIIDKYEGSWWPEAVCNAALGVIAKEQNNG